MLFVGNHIFQFESSDTLKDIAAYTRFSVTELCDIMKELIYGDIKIVKEENNDERDRTQDH